MFFVLKFNNEIVYNLKWILIIHEEINKKKKQICFIQILKSTF